MLPGTVTGACFLTAIELLVSAKRTLELTPHQAETWTAALSIYQSRPSIVHRAVIELATDEDPFPDLSKLLLRCEKIRRETDGTLPQDAAKLKFSRTAELAKAWGLPLTD